MISARVNKQSIVLRFDGEENLPSQEWEMILDQLKSEHIPRLYQRGKSLHVSIEPDTAKTRVVIYLTDKTATKKQAIDVLRHWNIDVRDEAKNESPKPLLSCACVHSAIRRLSARLP